MAILHPLVILVVVLTVVNSEFLAHKCDLSNNYTEKSTYQANLKQLQSSLLSSIISSGFSNSTVGQNPNQMFGLASCRGDVSAESCQSCIKTTFNNASTLCPYGKGEVVWYEYCFLHYSDTNFFSKMVDFGHYLCNKENASDPEQLATILGQLMNTLASQAASSPKLFAAGFVNYTSFRNLYGLAQCTRDLSKEECDSCLHFCVEKIPTYCDRSIGGRLFGETCNIRFETYKFYNTSAVPNAAAAPTPPTAPPPAETTNKGNNGGSTNVAMIVGPVVAGALVILLAVYACSWARKKHHKEDESIGTTEGSLLFDLTTIRSATNNFSEENRLGEGGFGPVYKGKLIKGQEIAVKRLSGNSHQGLEQLKNEVKLLAKLQHKNLVKLFGCCLDGSEKLLVYEYLSNTSLDKFLFDPVKRPKLDWQMRLKIIEGTARGLVYLHEDSRIKIVHRDLKVSNILLDADMNPKIADFGLAKLFNFDATHANTSRIAGTYGYMAPEYAMRGLFSTKSDVFSFGIIVLEILTGRTIYCMPGQMDEDLLFYVWRHWSQGVPLNVIDKSIHGPCPSQELIRCMHIALLCVLEDPAGRPDIATVILMLRSQSMTLPAAMAPMVFFRSEISTTGSQVPDIEENYGPSMSENVETGRNA